MSVVNRLVLSNIWDPPANQIDSTLPQTLNVTIIFIRRELTLQIGKYCFAVSNMTMVSENDVQSYPCLKRTVWIL